MTAGKSILAIGEDQVLRQILVEQLQVNNEYLITVAPTGREALQYLERQYFDAILVASDMGDLTTHEICRQMRGFGVTSPIIIISETSTDLDTILSLDAGASDYISKPIKIDVLLARLRAHIRQYEQSEYAIFNIGRYSFRPGGRVLLDNKTKEEIRLTDKETAIIKFLYRSKGKVVSKSVLLHEVWGYNAGMATHTLETHIYRLRQKLERDPSKSELLVTEDDGYKLVI